MATGGSHSDGGSDRTVADDLIERLDRAITAEDLDLQIADGERYLESGGDRYQEVEQAVERARLRREET